MNEASTELETFARVSRVAAEMMGQPVERFTPETYMFDVRGFDSLDDVDFVIRLEEEFDLDIPTDNIHHLMTLGPAALWIDAELRKRSRSAASPLAHTIDSRNSK